ncbi:MAG: major capsid family protein, partial [Cyanobacteria bacterium J06648_11]
SQTSIATQYVEGPEVLLLPAEQYNIIASRPYPENSASGETILSFLLKTQRAVPNGLKAIAPVPYLKGQGVGGTDVMVSYRKRSTKLKMVIPLDVTAMPPQIHKFNTEIYLEMRTGGIEIRKPLSVRYASGI